MSTLIDPRFGYDISVWSKNFWTDVEEDLKKFASNTFKISNSNKFFIK
jgi:hypothetical protein